MSRMALSQGALLLALLGSALAGPILVSESSSNECAATCPETSKFGYEEGKSYIYNYESVVLTHIPGASTEQSKLKVAALVHVHVLSQCEMLLKLTDVKLADAHPENTGETNNVERAWDFKRSLQQRALRFAFQDGHVTSLCPEAGEEKWVLNIKRAILSGFQNTMNDLSTHTRNKETDVSGECYVDYSSASSWSGYTITKVKDVLSCSRHAHYDSFFQTAAFDATSRIQSLPLLRSTHECTQTINSNNIISATSCQEKHVFRPFSTSESGATTQVTFSLTLRSSAASERISQGEISQRESLIFDYEPKEETQSGNRRSVNQVKRSLTEICAQTNTKVEAAAPAAFTDLIKKMRELTPDQLETLHTQIKSTPICSRAEKFFHDAIPSLGTPASVRMVRVLVTSGEMAATEADKMLTSLAFLTRPTKEILTDIKDLLSHDATFTKATLAVTSMVHSYCRIFSDCGDHQEVKDILNILDEALGYNCVATTLESHRKIMSVLKGIGNAGHSERIVPKLNRCMLNSENEMEIRVAAAQAFRRMPCTAERDELMNVFLSTSQDSELRINAYLMLMACPTPDIINRVKGHLLGEEVNQVGSFVWTHLTNLQETTSPFKQDIRKILETESLKKVFNIDKRKFSRNIEWSAFSDSLNAGATVDSNLIWSPKSFLPRSANLNLTLDMFGQSLNLIEVGGRSEGIDNMLETLYGPTNDINNHVPNGGRRRRAATSNVIKNLHDEYALKRDESKGSYYVRMFGNEISFDDFHAFKFENVMDNVDMEPLFEKLAKEHNIDYTSSGMFFDTAMVVPTVAGLPLRLKTDGTAVVNMKVRGKIDVRNLFKPKSAMVIQGSVRPSAAVQVNGEMSVDAMMARTGLRLVNNMRTDTLADGKIHLRDGNMFDMDINLPDDSIEIFHADTKFFIEYRDAPREQAMLREGRIEKRACFDSSIVKVTGLELCGAVSLPHAYKVKTAPWYPLTGPSSVSLVLNKKDTFTGFHFDGKYVKEAVPRSSETKDIARVSFSTPGSKVDREFTFEYTLDKPGKRVDLSLKTPFKTMEFAGSLVDTEARKQFKATGKLDSDTYDVLARLNIEKNRYNVQYRPLLEITIPRREPLRLVGSVLYRPGKKADVDITMENVLDGPLTIKGDVNFIKKLNKYQGSLEFDSSLFDATLEGAVTRGDGSDITTDVEVLYKKGSGRQHTIKHSMQWKAASLEPTSPNVLLKSTFTSTQWSDYNCDIDLLLNANAKEGRFRLDGGLTNSPKRLTMVNSHKLVNNRKRRTGEISVSLALPHFNMDYKDDLEYTIGSESIRVNSKHRAGSSVSTLAATLERQSIKPLKTLVELTFTSPGRNHVFRDTVIESSPGTYDHELLLQLQPDWKAEMTSYYKCDPMHELSADITIPNLRPIKIESHMKMDITDFSYLSKVKYGRDVYSTSAIWKFTKNGPNVAGNSKFEFVIPRRSIVAKSQMTASRDATTSEMEVLWDAAKDPQKRFMIKTDTSHGNPGSINLRTEWYPNKFVDVTLTRKRHVNGWKHPEGNFEGKMVLTSSYRKARAITATFSHERNPRQLTAKTEVSWDNNKKINTDMTLVKRNGLQDAILTIKTTTPFESFKTGKYILDYSLRGNTFDSKNRFDWNEKFAELGVTGKGDVPNHIFEGGITFTTSYDGWKRMAMSGRHSDNGKLFNSQLQGTWRDGSTMVMALNMNHDAKGWYVTNSGDLSVSVPFGPYRNNKLIWNHNNDNKVFKSHMEVQLDAEKSIFDLDSGFKTTKRQHAFNVKTTFKSPYDPVKDLAFTFDHHHDPRHWQGITTSGSVKWAPSKEITFTKKVDFEISSFIKKDLVITTPFSGYETIKFDMINKLENDRFTLHKELKWGSNNKIALDGFVVLTFPETSGEIRFISTFPEADRFFFSVENKEVNNVWKTNTLLEYPTNKKIELNTQVGWTNSKKFHVQLTTPYERVGDLVFDMEHKGPANNFVTKFEAEHYLLEGKAALTIQSDVRNLEDIDIKTVLTTRFQPVSSAKIALTHKKQADSYRSFLSYERPGYKSSIGNTFKGDWAEGFDEQIVITHKNTKIETGVALAREPKIDLTFFFKSPYEGYRNIHFNVNYDTRVNTALATVLTYGENRLAGTMDYSNNREGITGNLVVETPFTDYERSSLTFTHKGKWNNFKNSGSLSVGGRDFNTEGEFLYRANKIKVVGKLTTPYAQYQTISIDFDHTGDPSDMKQELELVYGDSHIKITHEFKFKNERLNHKLLVITPYSLLNSLNMELRHNGPLNNFKNEGTFEYNGKVITGSSEFKYGKRATKGSISIKTPEIYTIRFVHKGTADDFTNNIRADISGQPYSANTDFKLNRNNVELTTSIHTPHRRLRVMQATIKHRGTLNNFQNSFELDVNNKMYTGEAELKLTGNEITATANFKLPEVYSLTFTHKGGFKDFENTMVIGWDTNKYEAASSFSFKRDTIAGSASVKVPTEYSLTFGHTGNRNDFSNDFRLLLNGHISSGNSRFHYRGNDLTASANLELPYESYDKFGVTVKHRGVATNFKTEAEIEVPFNKVKKLEFEVEHSGSLPEFSTKAKVAYNKREYGFSVSHEGNSNDFTSKAGYEYNGDKVEGEVKYTKTGSGPNMNNEGHIKIETPYKHLRVAETKFSHSIQDDVYRGQIESLYNDIKYFDSEYSFIYGPKKTLTLTMREPNPALIVGNYERTPDSIDTDVLVNWDTDDRNSNVKVSLSAKREPKYEFEIKVIQPKKTTMFKTDLVNSGRSFEHGLEVQWGNGAAKKADYKITGGKNRGIYNGRFELRTPYQNMEALVEHSSRARAAKTVFEIGNIEKLTVIQTMSMKQPNFRNFDAMLTIRHPRLQRDVKFEVEGIIKPRPYAEGRINIEFGSDEVTFTGKVGDVSTSAKTSYIAGMRLTHPGTFTDFQFDSEFGEEGEEVFANMEVNHKSAVDKTMKTASLRSTINKLRRRLNLDLVTPFNEVVKLNGRIDGDAKSGVYNLNLGGNFAGERITADLELDKNAPLADLRIKYKQNRQMRMYAKYISVSTVQFEAYRQTGNNKIIDSQLALRLNNSRLIHGRAYFRPESASEIQDMLSEDHGIESYFQRVKTAIDEDLDHRERYLRSRLQTIISFVRDVLNHMDDVYNRAERAYNDAYRRDHYYLRTSHLKAKEVYGQVRDYSHEQYLKYKPMMDRHYERMSQGWETMKNEVAQRHARFMNKWDREMEDLKYSVGMVVGMSIYQFGEFIRAPWFSIMEEKMTELYENIYSRLRESGENFRNHPYVRPVIESYYSMRDSEYLQPLRDFHRDVTNHMDRMRTSYNNAYRLTYRKMSELFDTEEMRKVQEWGQDLVNHGKRAYQYYGLADVEETIRNLRAANMDELKTQALVALKNYLQLNRTRITVWDPKRGDYQFELYLPIQLHNLRDFPVDEIRRLVSKTKLTLARLRPDEHWIPWDTIYQYKISTNPSDWIPPFPAHATIAGNQHFMTFDKNFYEFSGECSYLLAHDFIDGNFSVVINYDNIEGRMTKKSITVLSNSKQVEIFPSYKVTLDGQRTELPVEFDDTSIVRLGNRIRLDNSNGVTVTCDLPYDRCTVNVTGWYFAKTAGLFGTYNNEPYDDLMTSERRLATSPELLADSWTVGRKCRVHNNAEQRVIDNFSKPHSIIYKTCAKYFEDQSSTFRPCFRMVDHKPFMQMCINDLAKRDTRLLSDKDVCDVAAFYVEECGRHGVPLRQPKTCVTCKLGDSQKFTENDDRRLEGTDVPQSADVVFVVSHKPCNKDVIPKLKKLLDGIEDSLKEKGMRNNRYGVVGFGGEGILAEPHTHSIEGQVFNRDLKVGQMITGLPVSRDDSLVEHAIDALDMAARYPFRAGVSKTLILLTCDTCSENHVSYPDMAELLLSRDIKLHLISPHDFRMRSNSPKANNILGMTRYTVYTNKHVGDLDGDVTLRRQTYMPKDLCAALSHDTEAAIFNANKFKDAQWKNFRTIVASVVADKASPSECQVCECVPDESGVGQPVCHSCIARTPLYGLLPKFEDYGVGNFMDIPAEKPVRKAKKLRNLSKKHRRRGKNM